MAPPVTPSPHRFLLAKSKSTSTHQSDSPSPSQFNSVPRFNVPSVLSRPSQHDCPQTIPSVLSHCIFSGVIAKDNDYIESEIKSSPHSTYPKAKFPRPFSRQDNEKHFESSPKRKKLVFRSELRGEEHEDQRDEIQEISSHLVSNINYSQPFIPFTPKSPVMDRTFRFMNTPTVNSRISSESRDAGSSFLKAPIFRPPEPSLEHYSSITELQPIQFSPQRRGHKYIFGGLAATLQGWLVNIENIKPGQPNGIAPLLMNVVVDEFIRGGIIGITLISGKCFLMEEETQEDVPRKAKFLLASKGPGTESQSYRQIVQGSNIGIKAPTWQVDIKGDKWNVAVDWIIVS